MPKASTYPARALTNILGLDASGNVGLMSTLLLQGQFGITAAGITTQSFDGASWMTMAAPNTKSFMLTTYDHAGNRTRTFDQATGRIDVYANSAAGQTSGSPIAVVFDNASPANSDILGHYAFRGRDTNGNLNTYAYLLATAETVAVAGLNSALELGVMKNQPAGSGNAQPNVFAVLDGNASSFSLPSGFQYSTTGTNAPFLASHTSGPNILMTNSANTRTASFGVVDNFNAGINSTGGGGVLLQVAGVTAFSVSASGTSKQVAETRTSKTANYTIVAADGGTQFDNTAAAGEVDFTLPAAPTTGTKFGFNVVAAQVLKVIAPASTTINISGTVSAAAGNITSSQVGAYVELEYIGGSKYVSKGMPSGTGGSTGAGGWTVT